MEKSLLKYHSLEIEGYAGKTDLNPSKIAPSKSHRKIWS